MIQFLPSEALTQISLVLLLVFLVLLVSDRVVDRLLDGLVVLKPDLRIPDKNGPQPSGAGSNRRPASRATKRHDVL
jgi:hypothetical protein